MIEITPPKVYLLATDKECTRAIIRFDGFIKHMGSSIGNALTRILLCHIPGYAVQAFNMTVDDNSVGKFEGINGFIENETGLEGNLAAIRLKVTNNLEDNADVINIYYDSESDKSNKSVITAGDLIVPDGVTILNKDLVLLTKGSESKCNVKLHIKCGYNAYFSSSRELSKAPDDRKFITINSVYSPVLKAHYNVSEGNNRLLENLTLTIETTGAVTPIEALVTACKLLSTYSDLMSCIEGLYPTNELTNGEWLKEHGESYKDLKESMNASDTPIEELGLSSMVYNYLKLKDVKTVGDIAKKGITYDKEFLNKLINNKSGVYTSINGQEVNIDENKLIEELEEINFSNISKR